MHAWLYEWEGAKQSDLAEAEKNSQKALSLAPSLSESHSSRGFVLSLAKEYEEGESEFREAVRLNPNSFDVYYLYGRASFARGEIEKSAEMFLKASQVRPEDFQSLLLLGQSLGMLGRDANNVLRQGIERARKQLALNPADRRALSLSAGSLFEIGEKEEAFKWMDKALELYPEDAGVLINATCLFAKANNKEKALNLLETAVERGYGNRDWMEHDPDYDCLREDPHFKMLLDKLQGL